MYKKRSIMSGRVFYVIFVLLLLSGCVEFSSSSGYRPGSTNYPSNKLNYPPPANESSVDQGEVKKNGLESEEPIEEGKVNEQIRIPSSIAVNVGGRENKPVSFLDRYEEQLRRLDANKMEIDSLKGMVKSGDLLTDDLQTRLDVAIKDVELGKVKIKELEALNKKIAIEFSEKLQNDGKRTAVYKKQVKELKLRLVKSQISETKVKQELVRIKTQYLMDKKKWAEKER